MCFWSHLFHISNHTNFIRIFQYEVLLHKIKFAYLFFSVKHREKKTIFNSCWRTVDAAMARNIVDAVAPNSKSNSIVFAMVSFFFFFIFTIFFGFVFGLVKRVDYGGSLGKCTIRVFSSGIRTRHSLYLQHAHREEEQCWKFNFYSMPSFSPVSTFIVEWDLRFGGLGISLCFPLVFHLVRSNIFGSKVSIRCGIPE